MNRIIVTGGAGFIGSAFIRNLLNKKKCQILNIDKLTYSANLNSLSSLKKKNYYNFIKQDICNLKKMSEIVDSFKPNSIVNFAAETHVDNSINGPLVFIKSNILGTYSLLEAARKYWQKLKSKKQEQFRFHHVSTDEVYGDLDNLNELFTEDSPYLPSSPYAASKAGSDHLVRAWHRTYRLPILITNCSNNYGPYQYFEKLIPLTINNAINGKPIPIYGHGNQIRDWIYVDDHVNALLKVLKKGKIGQTYNIGSNDEKKNIDVVLKICQILDRIIPEAQKKIKKHKNLITYVKDRPGHDQRYAIDNTKIKNELGWYPKIKFNDGLMKTIKWTLRS